MGVRIDALDPAINASPDDVVAAMTINGETVKLTLAQVIALAQVAPSIATAVAELLDGVSADLNTLRKLSAAVNDDPNFADNIQAIIDGRLRVDGGQTLTLLERSYATENLRLGRLMNCRNIISNPLFTINQRVKTGTVVLAAGQYGHDRWKAGASGCTYSFAFGNGAYSINITAGSLMQAIPGQDFWGRPGDYVLSWSGTAEGRINSGTYDVSGVPTATITGSGTTTIEFRGGNLARPQLERDFVTDFSARNESEEWFNCLRYYEKSYHKDIAPGSVSEFGAQYYQMATTSTNHFAAGRRFQVPKYQTPSVLIYTPDNGTQPRIYNYSNSSRYIVDLVTAISTGGFGYLNVTGTFTAGHQYGFHFVADAEL